jgi:hypothetical protein
MKTKEKFIVALGFCFFFIMPLVGGLITSEPTEVETTTTETKPTIEEHPKEQQYVVRYATPIHTDDNGVTTYEDYDGNIWCVQDAPETNGDVKITFNSMETFSIEDDVVIDITEIK